MYFHKMLQSYKKPMYKLALIHWSVSEIAVGLEHLTCKGESRSLFCLEKRGQKEDLHAVFNYLMGS